MSGCDGVESSEVPLICKPGGASNGLFFPIGGDTEANWPDSLKVILYFIGLSWCFMGVAIIADVFMSAIETITSKKKRVFDKVNRRYKTVKVWNDTVANLTLMALGSSAPEILLSVIEAFKNDFYAGELGPGTIVGSAAFNLLCISAVCVCAIPSPEVRMIKDVSVFAVTGTFSILAYVWLIVILMGPTDNRVDILEGLLTFGFFFCLVGLAFCADKGFFGSEPASANHRSIVAAEMTEDELAELISSVRREFGDIDDDTVLMVIEKRTAALPSKAALRQQNHGSGRAPTTNNADTTFDCETVLPKKDDETTAVNKDQVTIEFATSCYAARENIGELAIQIKRYDNTSKAARVKYRTEEATAKAGSDYIHVEGVIEFPPGEIQQDIKVKIMDDEEWEGHEEFYVVLFDAQCEDGTAVMGPNDRTTVTIIDDDDPGVIAFEKDCIEIEERDEDYTVNVSITRKHGSKGDISCKYATEDGSAVTALDFIKLDDTLVLKGGEAQFDIPVVIKARGRYESTENFRLVLTDPTGGARFEEKTDGGKDCDICTIYIKANKDYKNTVDKLAKGLVGNWDKARMGRSNWKEQFVSAIYVGGSPEDQKEARARDWIFHLFGVFWKVLFATVPPPDFYDGWLCFVIALVFIGLLTAVVGDLAGLLGCSLGMDPSITAITFVALGTSLPDTFASKTAAIQDPYADASIGNITGSNSVNVFLGLGLPWTICAFVWHFKEEMPCKWYQRYPEQALQYPDGAFVVPAGGLGFSVAIFTACALACFACLIVRRKLFGGELGGPLFPKIASGVLMVSLWFVYVSASWTYVEMTKDA